jgi:hypothetical protein
MQFNSKMRARPTRLSHLAHANVHERLGGRVGDLQKLHDGRPVVADGHLPPVEDELVHPPRSQGRPDGVGHRLARVDVADQLGLALFRSASGKRLRRGKERVRAEKQITKRRRSKGLVSEGQASAQPHHRHPPPPTTTPPPSFQTGAARRLVRRLTCEVSVPSRRRMMPGLIIVPLLLPRRAQVLWAVGTYSTAVSRYASVLFLGALVARLCNLLCNLQCFCSFIFWRRLAIAARCSLLFASVRPGASCSLQSGDRPTHSTYSTHSRFYGTEHSATCRSICNMYVHMYVDLMMI